MRSGLVQLDRPVATIRVGHRHRKDLGDLTDLVASIGRDGLLQPITIAPDGTLLCGARRLAAVKQLGWRTVHVWVRGGVSDRLQQLLAEQTENTLRKAFSPREAAALYRELKTLIAEDNARRQQASRFGQKPRSDGAAESAAPSQRTSRAQAAKAVTGRSSHSMLEHIGRLERIAADPAEADHVRVAARQALEEIEATGKVDGPYQRVLALRRGTTRPARPAPGAETEPDTPAGQDGQTQVEGPTGTAAAGRRRRGVEAFLLTWRGMQGWADAFDPATIGPQLTDEQWADFERTIAATLAFADAARTARSTASAVAG